jgi:hypothetical protein
VLTLAVVEYVGLFDVERAEAVSLSHDLHPRLQGDNSRFTILREGLNEIISTN